MRKYYLILLFIITLGYVTAKTFDVTEFSSIIDINHDGTLEVEENFLYNFKGGPFRWVSRDVRAPNNGFIVLQEALIDGESIQKGNGAGMISVKHAPNLDVKFNFNGVHNQETKFTLKYKVFNAIKPNNTKAVFKWSPLPDEYEFIIRTGKVVVNYPTNIPLYEIVSFLEESKAIIYEESGNSLICSFNNLKGKTFKIKSNLPLAAMSLETFPLPKLEPELYEKYPELKSWAVAYKIMLFLVLAFLITVIIILIIRNTKAIKELPEVKRIPSKKHPALVARLIHVGSDDINLIPVLMHMAFKKLIFFTQMTNKKGKTIRDFYVDISQNLDLADDFDHGYLELLRKESERTKGRIELKSLVTNAYRHKKDLLKLLNEKFIETGFVDVKQKKIYFVKLTLFFVSLIVWAALGILGSILFTKGIAWAPLPAFLVVTYWIHLMLHLDDKAVLSEKGFIRWREWKAFKSHISKELFSRRGNLDPIHAEGQFPYILIMGYGQQYLRHFQRRNIVLDFPNLGEVADVIDSLNTLITVVAVTSANTSRLSGGVGGGGAGGSSAG